MLTGLAPLLVFLNGRGGWAPGRDRGRFLAWRRTACGTGNVDAYGGGGSIGICLYRATPLWAWLSAREPLPWSPHGSHRAIPARRRSPASCRRYANNRRDRFRPPAP